MTPGNIVDGETIANCKMEVSFSTPCSESRCLHRVNKFLRALVWFSKSVQLRLGQPNPSKKWEWSFYYDPVKSLNPQFYRPAVFEAKLPGPSQLHLALLDDVQFFGLTLPTVPGVDLPFGTKMIGETVIDLEDRWFCEEWCERTINKPREVRDLYNPAHPGISVGKLMVMVDMKQRVDAEDMPVKNIDIAGRQMPIEMRLIIWNLKNCAPKNGYTRSGPVRFPSGSKWHAELQSDLPCDLL
jgi:hypothetical protein